jgi:hypothetical protein
MIFLLNESLYGQLGPSGIGSFESNVHGKWKAAPENLDFTNSDSDFFEQSGSLKVISGGEHTLINYDASNFNKQIGQEVNISFYAKSKKGNSIGITIKDGWGDAAEETLQTQTIRSNEWSYYSFNFIPTTASTSGKIKLIFASSGAYHIDGLTLENKSPSNLYVSANAGGGGNGSLASPFNTIQQAVNSWQKGDIIYVRSGTYYNSNHGSGTNNNQVVNLSLAYNNAATAPDIYNPLVIRNYLGEHPKIKFDGTGGFIGGNSGTETSYLEISGFEIEGPNANITYSQAITNRTNFVNQVASNPNAQPQKKFTGRGIAIWSGHHIILNNNKVYNCPNSGIRVNNGDYVVIAHNQVYNTTWWSFSAESAIVIAQSKHIDDKTFTIKMRITHNRTYDNINKIPYFNKTYMNNGTCNGVTANSSKSDKYGCDVQDYIIDGSGCYITRNNSNGSGANDQNPNGQYKGTFYFANNVSYGNGLNGLVVHKTNNSIVANNTIYENGEIPTNINITYGVDWKDALNHGRQGTSGITIHSSYNVKVFNNVSWAKQANDNAFQIFSVNTQNNPNAITGSNNVLAFGEVSNTGISFFPNGFYVDKRSEKADLFKNSAAFDFDLPQSSYLVDNGVQNNNIPLYDINSNIRVNPDIGAFEYSVSSSKQSAAESLTGFENINKDINDPDFNLNASSNSSGSITYSTSNSSVASVSGNTVSIIGAGTSQITLNQAEDDNYEAFSKNISLTITSEEGSGLGNNEKNTDNPFVINIGKSHYNSIINMEDILDDERSYGLTNHHHLSRFSSLDVDWNGDGLNDIFMNFAYLPEIGSFSGLLIQEIINDSIKFRYDPTYKVFFQGDAGNIAKSVGDFNNDGKIDVYYHTENYHGEDGKQPSSYVFNQNDQGLCRWNTYDIFYINNGNGFDAIDGFDDDNGCPQGHAGNIIFSENGKTKITGFSPSCNDSYWINYSISGDEVIKDPFLVNTNCNEPGYFHEQQYAQGINYVGNKIYIPSYRSKYKYLPTGRIGFRGDPFWIENNLDNLINSKRTVFQQWKVQIFDRNTYALIDEVELSSENFVLDEGSVRFGYQNFEYVTGRLEFGHEWFFHVIDFNNDGNFEYFVNAFPRYVEENSNNFVDGGQRIIVYNNQGEDITNQVIGWGNFQDYFELSGYSSELNNGRDVRSTFNIDPTQGGYTGIHLYDINNDGLIDLIPQTGWNINFQDMPRETQKNSYIIFMNNGEKFFPTVVNFNDNFRTANNFLNYGMQGFKIPYDMNNDGFFEMVHIEFGNTNNPNNKNGNIEIFEFSFDNDKDGVINQNDAKPNDPYSNSNDVNGNRIFSLPNDNFSISIENLSCRGSSNGSIAISAKDENLNYTLTINGNETYNLNSSSGYSKSIADLNSGQYNLCFTVEGESGYNQCFDINIAEPAPLSASSRVNNANKSISFDLSGSDKYIIVHNGIEKDFDHSNPKIDLKKGVNFLEVKTDKLCQGSYTEEVFVSEEVEFYPNPTKDNINLYIHGKDNTVDIRVIDGDGNILKTSCNEIHASRKVQINLEEFSKGIYLIQLRGETVDKTVKIVRE